MRYQQQLAAVHAREAVLLDIMQALNWPMDSADKLHSHLHSLGAAAISLAQVHTLLGSHSHSHALHSHSPTLMSAAESTHSHPHLHAHSHEHAHAHSDVDRPSHDHDHHHHHHHHHHHPEQLLGEASADHRDSSSSFSLQDTRPRSSLLMFGDAERFPRRNSHMLSDVAITPPSDPSEQTARDYSVGDGDDAAAVGGAGVATSTPSSPLILTTSPLQDEDIDANLLTRPANQEDPYEAAIQSRPRGGSISTQQPAKSSSASASSASESESDVSAATASDSTDTHSQHQSPRRHHHRDASFAFDQLANVVVPPELMAGMQQAVELVENQQHQQQHGTGGQSGLRRRGCMSEASYILL
jgi:hypothetical protein